MTIEEAHKALIEAWYLPASERHIFLAAAHAAMLAVVDDLERRGSTEGECMACGSFPSDEHLEGCDFVELRARLAALMSPAEGEKE
jgi:hypothetical protein